MISILFFYRNAKIGFSIGKVFEDIQKQISKYYTTKKVEMFTTRSTPIDIIKNLYGTYKYRNKKGIHHITGHIHEVALALIGVKTVLTIHDLVFIDNVKNPIKRFYKWLFWLYLPVKLVDQVTCISKQTKNNILKHVSINPDKITVIYNPVGNDLNYTPKKFNPIKPVILHIGTGWNKNLDRVIYSLKDISCCLLYTSDAADD